MKSESGLREYDAVLGRLCRQQETLGVAEQTLREQCQEMGRLLSELQQKHQNNHSHCKAEIEVLRMGNECQQQLVGERDQQLAELNQRLAAVQPEQPHAKAHLEELQTLRSQLDEKEALIEQLRAAPAETPVPAFSGVTDHDYEAELTEFRRQLEADRQELNQEIQQLRARNAELNDVARDAELQLSRERAQLARERVQLDRLREEIRHESERAEHEAGVRDRLVAIDRLKDEVAERNRLPDPSTVTPEPAALRKKGSSIWRRLNNQTTSS